MSFYSVYLLFLCYILFHTVIWFDCKALWVTSGALNCDMTLTQHLNAAVAPLRFSRRSWTQQEERAGRGAALSPASGWGFVRLMVTSQRCSVDSPLLPPPSYPLSQSRNVESGVRSVRLSAPRSSESFIAACGNKILTSRRKWSVRGFSLRSLLFLHGFIHWFIYHSLLDRDYFLLLLDWRKVCVKTSWSAQTRWDKAPLQWAHLGPEVFQHVRFVFPLFGIIIIFIPIQRMCFFEVTSNQKPPAGIWSMFPKLEWISNIRFSS